MTISSQDTGKCTAARVGVVGALLVTALYLVAVRGEALILDLAKLGNVFCFLANAGRWKLRSAS